MDIHGKIQEFLAETMRVDQFRKDQPLSEVDFLDALQRRGIIDDVMKELHFSNTGKCTDAEKESPPRPLVHPADKNITQLGKSELRYFTREVCFP